MACPSLRTGERYLETALQHIDCQAQSIGSFGYMALSEPGSTLSIALTGVLVIFVALFGLRIALGYPILGHDLAGHAIRLVIVLTLATSWPAFKVIGYDVVVRGPAEVVQTIGAPAELPGSDGSLTSRLQNVDDGLAVLNETGAGRRGVQQGDWFQLGFTRSAFLTGTLGPLALVRLSGGILLALAPLVAGLLLFGFTRSIFTGWAKALAAVFLATVLVSVLLSVQLALMEPWLLDVIRQRAADREVLSAPTEGLTMTLAFALMSFAAIALAGWIAFHSSLSARLFPRQPAGETRNRREEQNFQTITTSQNDRVLHGPAVAASVARVMERDQRLGREASFVVIDQPPDHRTPAPAQPSVQLVRRPQPLGSTHRSSGMTTSRSRSNRDEAR